MSTAILLVPLHRSLPPERIQEGGSWRIAAGRDRTGPPGRRRGSSSIFNIGIVVEVLPTLQTSARKSLASIGREKLCFEGTGFTGCEKNRCWVGPGFTGCGKTHVLYQGTTLVVP